MSGMIDQRCDSIRRLITMPNDGGTVVRTTLTTVSNGRNVGVAMALIGGACCAANSLAQQGHPLVGSWSGDWGTSATERHRMLLVLDYDGQSISGVINPGRAPIALTSATLDPDTWSVRFEVTPSADNGSMRYLIEGQLENLGSITERSIVGTWLQGERHGDFRIVMN
jgi:hypothetical protein